MPMKDPTRRFSDRVENYVKYRPSFPQAVVALLQRRCGLTHKSVVADIGSGTGIFAKLLLEAGCRIIGVEPNTEMRQAAVSLLADYPGFTIVDGTAAPNVGKENQDPMMWELQRIFDLHQENGRVEFLYKTEVYAGQLGDT